MLTKKSRTYQEANQHHHISDPISLGTLTSSKSSAYAANTGGAHHPSSHTTHLFTATKMFARRAIPSVNSFFPQIIIYPLITTQAFRAATRATTTIPTPRTRFLTPFQARLLSDEVRSAIDRAIASSPVVLFMKGTPETPQCGFSRASIQILGMQGVDPDKFTAFNVLEDQELRQGTEYMSLNLG